LSPNVIWPIVKPIQEARGQGLEARGLAQVVAVGQSFENAQGHVGIVGPRAGVPSRQDTFTHLHIEGRDGPAEFVGGAEGVPDRRGDNDAGRAVG
jgi:hypothetical protein